MSFAATKARLRAAPWREDAPNSQSARHWRGWQVLPSFARYRRRCSARPLQSPKFQRGSNFLAAESWLSRRAKASGLFMCSSPLFRKCFAYVRIFRPYYEDNKILKIVFYFSTVNLTLMRGPAVRASTKAYDPRAKLSDAPEAQNFIRRTGSLSAAWFRRDGPCSRRGGRGMRGLGGFSHAFSAFPPPPRSRPASV